MIAFAALLVPALLLPIQTHNIRSKDQNLSAERRDESNGYRCGADGKEDPICLRDAGWLDHYGLRPHDVNVERI